jgi:hypothetical protein
MRYAQYRQTGDTVDLDGAIDTSRQAATAAPAGHPERPSYLADLGDALFARYEQTWDRRDLDEAIEAGQQVADAAPPDNPNPVRYLSNLGTWRYVRSRRFGGDADLDAAIDVARQAAAAAPPGHPNRAKCLGNLVSYLTTRYGRTGESADLDEAVDAGRQAVTATPPDNPELPMYLTNLSMGLFARYEHAGHRTDLDAAIEAGQQAVAAPDNPYRALCLSNLVIVLTTRYMRDGDRADLDAAVDAGLLAVDTTPPGDPERAGRLANLANTVRSRYVRDGDITDLEKAIEAAREAVDQFSPGHPDRAGYLVNLGTSLLARYERAGDGADLNAAIDAEQRAVNATPPGNPYLASHLSALGAALAARYWRDGDGGDLDAAIAAERRAVDATPSGSPYYVGELSDLAASLLTRSRHTGDRTDLDTGIHAMLSSLEATPPGDPDRPGRLSNLGAALRMRYQRSGDSADLNDAVDVGQQAVDASSPGYADLAMSLSNLAASLYSRYGRAGKRADLDAALGCWRRAGQLLTAPPSQRLLGARNWGAAAADTGRMHDAANGYAMAVGLLATVAWHGLDRAAREEQLAQWAGLAVDAAACAVRDDRPEQAVELLEQGRSVLWTQALHLRSDLTRLAEVAPDLARHLDSIRDVLGEQVPAPVVPQPVHAAADFVLAGRSRQQQDIADLRRRKAREWDEVLTQVRALDGLEYFLAAVPYPELAVAAAEGPVVIVNASRHGCDALIVGTDRHVRVVDLPRMSRETTVDHAEKMLRALEGGADPGRIFLDREKDRHAILDVLDWLWDVLAEPVLASLGHTGPPKAGGAWPRVWWCPTGPLTVLPIHAAGRHPRVRTATDNSDCVVNRVISSYTPNLTALTRARQQLIRGPERQLTVGMPITPGQPPLPAVRTELEVLAGHFPPGPDNHQLVGSQATCMNALAAMASHSWIHLACHAGQEHADPDQSGFALWDGRLTITDLAGQPTQDRCLAFLSACQTATGSIRHLDEAIHLAAAMQFLGYEHVIASMWTIADSPAPYVADSVYGTLTQGGKADPGRAAEALHQAVHTLRDTDPTNPLLWASYVHLGP